MASFQIKDAYAVMNALARQATAQDNISVVDHQSFIDAGTATLATGTENVLNSIARTIAYVVIASRPYTGKFGLISATENQFNTRKGKISFYAADNEASGAFNTDLYTDLADGYDNGINGGASVGSMWEQKLPKVLERFFLSEAVWDKHYTTPMVQLQNAFNDEATFIKFMNGYMTEIQNDIESTIESRNRALVADRIAGTKLLADNNVLGAESAVDMADYFNAKCGTSYTRDEILQEHLTEFLELWVAKIKIDSDRLEERSALYHDPVTVTENGIDYNILRHTPKAMQKMFYYSELFTEAKARVLPEIFNPQYLDSNNGEAVTYWQSSKPEDRMKIKCKPAMPADSGVTSTGVELDYVIGLIFDTDAIQSINQFTGAFTTPVEARRLYTNTWYHYKFGSVQDYTENGIIYFLGEGGTTESFVGDGSEVDFVLDGSVREILKVTVDGTETTSYTYDADTNTITFTTAPGNGDAIEVWYK